MLMKSLFYGFLFFFSLMVEMVSYTLTSLFASPTWRETSNILLNWDIFEHYDVIKPEH